MSIIGGEFGESRLLQQRNLADELGLDKRIRQQYIPKINLLNYINSLQTPGLNMAFNTKPKKDYDVEIMWMNTCEDFTIADESCVRGGEQPSTNAHTYKLEKRIVKGFTIRDDEFRDNEYDANMAVAKTLIQIDKQICEEFAQYATGRLNLFSGVNQVVNGKGVINPLDNTITDIDPANWTAEIMAYFSRVLQMNRFDNAAFISGSNLYETLYVANAKRGDYDAGQDFQLWNDIPLWFDLFNIDSVNGADLYTYLVSQGALAVVNKAWNPAMAKYMDHHAYTMRSRFFPGFEYDVYYDNKCNESQSARYKDMVHHNWKIVLTADIFKNPYGCDAIEDDGVQIGGDNTGVLRFRNEVPTPTPTPTP